MENDLIFRISIGLFACLFCTGFYHRFRADKSNDYEKLSRNEEGWFILITLRLFGFIVWIGLILYMINPNLISWSYMPLPVWLRWFGVGTVSLSIPLMHWMFKSLGNNVTDTVVTRKHHSMVINGPYHYVRHPMYCIVFLLFTGFMLLTTSWFIGSMGLITMLLLISRTSIEEGNLIRRFGTAYKDYMARTNKFIPSIRLKKL